MNRKVLILTVFVSFFLPLQGFSDILPSNPWGDAFLIDKWQVSLVQEIPNDEFDSLSFLIDIFPSTVSLPYTFYSDGVGVFQDIQLDSSFLVPEELQGESVYLLLGKQRCAFKLYLNGTSIYSYGSFKPDYRFTTNEVHGIELPEELLNRNSENILRFRFQYNHTDITIAPVALGDRNLYQRDMQIVRFFSFTGYRYFAFIMFFIGLYYLAMFVYRRSERLNLLLAVATIAAGIYFLNLGMYFQFGPFLFLCKMTKSFIFLGLAVLCVYFIQYFNVHNTMIFRHIILASGCIFFIIMNTAPNTAEQTVDIFRISLFYVGFIILFFMYIAIRGFQKKNREALPILGGLVILTTSTLYDSIAFLGGRIPRIWFQGFGSIVFYISLFLTLAIKHVRMQRELERYSLIIEKKVQDRTRELLKTNKELQKSRIEADRANRAKTDFLAKMSHEMRTPLNGIIGFAEIVRTIDDPQELTTYSQHIIQESDVLLHIIDQVLDISKIEADKLVLDNRSFQLSSILSSIESTLGHRARNNGLSFRVLTDPAVPDVLLGDPVRLHQILMNLVGNAIKFTEKGGITISVQLKNTLSEVGDSQDNVILFTVSDTGMGIDSEHLGKIFERFVQEDNSISRRYGGSGLGTTIAKQLVELMGGRIWAESEKNVGTTFSFTIRVEKGFEKDVLAEIPALQPQESGKGKVLLVEDYETNQMVARKHLEDAGLSVEVASSGREAIEMFNANDYDLILMDVQMPDINGLEATEIIRATEKGKKIPILGVTANAFVELISTYLKSGMDGVITKPIKRRTFIQRILNVLNHSTHPVDHPLNVFRELDVSAPPDERNNIGAGTVQEENGSTRNFPGEDTRDILDFSAFSEEMGGDISLIREILSGFFRETKQAIDSAEQFWKDEDWKSFHRAVHSIKGGSANICARKLNAFSTAMERSIKEKSITDVEHKLKTLNTFLEELQQYYSDHISQWEKLAERL